MKTLVEIGEAARNLLRIVEEEGADGEIPAELDSFFSALAEEKERKLDSYVALIRHCQLRASARRDEADRLASRAEVDENIVKRLKARLQFFMELTGEKSIETDRYKITLAKNGGLQPVVVACKPAELPPEFQQADIKPRTEDIRNALLAGNEIPGCSLAPRQSHIRIY